MRKRTKSRNKPVSQNSTVQALPPKEQTPFQLVFSWYTAPPP